MLLHESELFFFCKPHVSEVVASLVPVLPEEKLDENQVQFVSTVATTTSATKHSTICGAVDYGSQMGSCKDDSICLTSQPLQSLVDTELYLDLEFEVGLSQPHDRDSARSGLPSNENANSPDHGRCTFPEYGKVLKDLKAHMLTHQNERPHKCPIKTCEYHTKGFARKYDKNRHVLSHYRGTMLCGICSSGRSTADRSFNRTDILKRHLAEAHGVFQPSTGGPTAAFGREDLTDEIEESVLSACVECSTCDSKFKYVLEFHEHLDDCVLRTVHQSCEGSSINAEITIDAETIASYVEIQKNSINTGSRQLPPVHDVFMFSPNACSESDNFVVLPTSCRASSISSSEQSALWSDGGLDSSRDPKSPVTEFADDKETVDVNLQSLTPFDSEEMFSNLSSLGTYMLPL
jgi:hypothetical protein